MTFMILCSTRFAQYPSCSVYSTSDFEMLGRFISLFFVVSCKRSRNDPVNIDVSKLI